MSTEVQRLVTLRSSRGRGVLLATVLGSGIMFLDKFLVGISLPQMDEDLHLGVSGFQWTVSGYLVTLSALLLLGGSLGDVYGRRRIYLAGLCVFTLSSVVCGFAGSGQVLIAARLIQGVGGALMTPASLAIIQSSFVPGDRAAAIGLWTGLSAFFTACGPLVGGFFVTYLSWRWAFFLNLPLIAIAAWATWRWVPRGTASEITRLDLAGAALAAVSLLGLTYWGIEGAFASLDSQVFGIAGLVAAVLFIVVESRRSSPLLPLSLFRSKQFTSVNLCTLIFYGAFVSGLTFTGIRLQTDLGYSALEAGLATLPANVEMLLLAGAFGRWSSKVGPRLPMTVGPLIVGAGLLALSRVDPGTEYWSFIFPAMLIWGLGLSMTVAPLTAAALSAVRDESVGIASAFNNAASTIGQSFGITLIPLVAGMGGATALGGPAFSSTYGTAVAISAGLSVVAACLAAALVPGPKSVSAG